VASLMVVMTSSGPEKKFLVPIYLFVFLQTLGEIPLCLRSTLALQLVRLARYGKKSTGFKIKKYFGMFDSYCRLCW